jgi:hypothetical protein
MSVIVEHFKLLSFREKKKIFRQIKEIYSEERSIQKMKEGHARDLNYQKTHEFMVKLIPELLKLGIVRTGHINSAFLNHKLKVEKHYTFIYKEMKLSAMLGPKLIRFYTNHEFVSVTEFPGPEKAAKKVEKFLDLVMTAKVINS